MNDGGINIKLVKKLFVAGLLSLTMLGCAGNGEVNKEEKSKGEKTEEVKKKSNEKYLSEKETRLLKEGDTLDLNALPDRRILEDMGLDYILVCQQFTYVTSDANETPKNLSKFEKSGEIEYYLFEDEKLDDVDDMVGWMNENKEYEWNVNKPTQIKIVSFNYGKDENDNVIKKIIINGQTHVVEPVCKECNK